MGELKLWNYFKSLNDDPLNLKTLLKMEKMSLEFEQRVSNFKFLQKVDLLANIYFMEITKELTLIFILVKFLNEVG